MVNSSEFYNRKDVMHNLRRKVLKNLDLAIESALTEGVQVLKKYDSLHFYLKNIGFGHKHTLEAVGEISKEMAKAKK